jgi:membrane protein DedA with SNARE-associated domain
MMTTQFIIEHIEWGVANAYLWGFVLVFVLMTIESSFIPFPSEVTMIPAGFLAYRGDLTLGNPLTDSIAVILCGLAGSLVGAFINYYLALFLGRPFLYRYGKYFLVTPNILSRAEEIFIEYGEITTFVCRLLPGIRQLISLPAGISRMSLVRFSTFTALGAGIWSAILVGIGYYLGSLSADMTYAQLVHSGKGILKENYIWIILFLVILILVYALIHHLVMRPKRKRV